MIQQLHIPVNPERATVVNSCVGIAKQEDLVTYFVSGSPTFSHTLDDKVGQRVALVQLLELGLATKNEVVEATGIHRTTLFRWQQPIKKHGVLGAVEKTRGPKERHKFTADKMEEAQEALDDGESIRSAARKVGVTEGLVRHAIGRGELTLPGSSKKVLAGPSERSKRDTQPEAGIAVRRNGERTLARIGKIDEAPPCFESVEASRFGGVLFALPALLSLGLLEEGLAVYQKLRKGFYGLQSTLLAFALMALLRIKSPEQLQFHAPGELGSLLGLDRIPEVKTLRRKLSELAERGQAIAFSRRLADRWIRQRPEMIGLLYIDGHVRAYHGRKHKLPKTYVSRRHLAMPATTDVWANDKNADPLFVVNCPANDSLIKMLKKKIIPEVRRLAGPERRVTICFDREGWSPGFFSEMFREGFDVLTYRKGKYKDWHRKSFKEVEGEIDRRHVKYKLAERQVEMTKGFKVREVRRLCENGHQTSVITTRQDLSLLEVAWRMFERWTQENFFRYMRQHYALDALVDRKIELADPERTVPNPARESLRKELTKLHRELHDLEKKYGTCALENQEQKRPSMRGFKVANRELGKHIRSLRAQCQEVETKINSLPNRVPLKKLLPEDEIVRLRPETKHLTDTIKMLAYRAESSLVRILEPLYSKSPDEGHALIREILNSPADIILDEKNKVLSLSLHSLATPRANAAAGMLCEILNSEPISYPGTQLTLRYQASGVA
jgi:transposase-like protein